MVNKVVEKKVIEEVTEVKVELTLTPDQYDVLREFFSKCSFEDVLRFEDDGFWYRDFYETTGEDETMHSEEEYQDAARKDKLLREILTQLRD